MTELKTCPFCGGEAKLYDLPNEHPYIYRAACTECSTAYGFSYSHSEKQTAIDMWNKRSPDEKVEQEIRDLKGAIDIEVKKGMDWKKAAIKATTVKLKYQGRALIAEAKLDKLKEGLKDKW